MSDVELQHLLTQLQGNIQGRVAALASHQDYLEKYCKAQMPSTIR